MITSVSNKSIKNVQALLSKVKERKKQGVFVVEGPKMSWSMFWAEKEMTRII